MRPIVRFLDDDLKHKIISEARQLICRIGVKIHNPEIVSMLHDYGAKIKDENNVKFTDEIIDRSLKTAPKAFKLFNICGEEAVDLSGYNINFTPGSSSVNIIDFRTSQRRKPTTSDYLEYVKVVEQLPYLASQSTAFIPCDVDENISDSYRLYLSLIHGEKPIITGTFSKGSFEVMRQLQLAVRESADKLRDLPLTVFSCCPTSPLQWSEITSQNIIDCAEAGIPVEFISMPLSGFVAPVTLVGTLVQHTAETLSGLAISQLKAPGAPILYGGAPAIFDVRYETTPMGAVETEMIDCAYNEIGKALDLPTQAYIGLSDSKILDTQAGLETSMGATLAALSGINNISGAGMLDFINSFSLEKLVIDNEICGMTLRMIKGINPKDDFPSLPRFEELLKEGHLLISDHSRKYLRDEHYFPGPAIDRAGWSRWNEEGATTLQQRADDEIKRMLAEYQPTRLDDSIKSELTKIMLTEARRYGMDKLPD